METYVGHVKSPQDAIVLFEACRLGQLPRVQRRLSEKERQLIKSGSVFVWDEREAGMRRWTDGKSWSASRVNGSFLTYREMEGKKGATSFPPPSAGGRQNQRVSPSQEDADGGMGDAPDGYRYRPDGLTKQSFSITTSTNQHLHLISYFSRSDLSSARLMLPSQDPDLRHIRPAKGTYPESTLQDNANTPALTRSPMVGAHFSASPHPSAASTPQYAQSRPMGHPYSPAYNYPPSPMHTPPSGSVHPSHMYSPYQNGMHSAPPVYASLPPHHRAPSGPTAFDRIPPPLGTSAMPPPPGMAQQHTAAYPQPLPPTSAPGAHHMPPNGYAAHPTPPNHQYSPSQSNQLAPFRNSHSPHNQSPQNAPGQDSKGAPPHDAPQERTPPRSSAGTIPSIGALINNSPPPRSERQPPPLASRQSAPAKRPGESNLGGFPEKKPYTEDTRALRQLDRAFAL